MSRIFSRAITLQPPKSDLVTQLKYATSAGEESTLEKAKNVVSDTIGTLKEKASDLKQAVTRSNQKTRDTTSGEMGFDSQRDYRKESYPHTGRFEKQQKISDLEHERNERGTDVYGRGREPSNPNKHVLQK